MSGPLITDEMKSTIRAKGQSLPKTKRHHEKWCKLNGKDTHD